MAHFAWSKSNANKTDPNLRGKHTNNDTLVEIKSARSLRLYLHLLLLEINSISPRKYLSVELTNCLSVCTQLRFEKKHRINSLRYRIRSLPNQSYQTRSNKFKLHFLDSFSEFVQNYLHSYVCVCILQSVTLRYIVNAFISQRAKKKLNSMENLDLIKNLCSMFRSCCLRWFRTMFCILTFVLDKSLALFDVRK